MVLGAAVGDGPGSGRVGADHPAQAAVVLAGGVGREEGPVRGRLLIQRGHHQPGLHPGPGAVGRYLEHPVHVAGEVHLDAGAHGASGKAGAHAAADQRESVRSAAYSTRRTTSSVSRGDTTPSGSTWLRPASVA